MIPALYCILDDISAVDVGAHNVRLRAVMTAPADLAGMYVMNQFFRFLYSPF